MTDHPTHPEVLRRLRLAAGHLRGVIGMIEAGEPCLKLAAQLHAVENAIAASKRIVIETHLDHCLEHALSSEGEAARAAADEFRAIVKHL